MLTEIGMFPNLKFIRMFHIGRGSLMDSVLTFNTFILEKGTCYKQIILNHVSFCNKHVCAMLNFIYLSMFYDCAAMIRSRANCFFFFFFFFSTKVSTKISLR